MFTKREWVGLSAVAVTFILLRLVSNPSLAPTSPSGDNMATFTGELLGIGIAGYVVAIVGYLACRRILRLRRPATPST